MGFCPWDGEQRTESTQREQAAEPEQLWKCREGPTLGEDRSWEGSWHLASWEGLWGTVVQDRSITAALSCSFTAKTSLSVLGSASQIINATPVSQCNATTHAHIILLITQHPWINSVVWFLWFYEGGRLTYLYLRPFGEGKESRSFKCPVLPNSPVRLCISMAVLPHWSAHALLCTVLDPSLNPWTVQGIRSGVNPNLPDKLGDWCSLWHSDSPSYCIPSNLNGNEMRQYDHYKIAREAQSQTVLPCCKQS